MQFHTVGNAALIGSGGLTALLALVEPGDRALGAWFGRRADTLSAMRVGLLSVVVMPLALLAGGQPDRSFGTAGAVATSPGPGRFAIDNAVVVTPSGSIVAAGSMTHVVNGGERSDFALVRYLSNGKLDTAFGGGVVITPILTLSKIVALGAQRDGRVVAAGVAYALSTPEFTLARYLPSGALDPHFGTGGIVTTRVLGGSFANGLAIQRDGRLVVAGRAADPSRNYRNVVAVARYLPSGALDPSFGSGGVVIDARGQDAGGIAVDAHGRILVAASGCPQTCVFRFTSRGKPDPRFGRNGQSADAAFEPPAALALDPAGRPVLAGAGFNSSTSTLYAARYTTSGALDPTFGSHGVSTVKPLPISGGPACCGSASAVLLGHGRIVLAGGKDRFGKTCGSFELVQLLANGKPDPSFGKNGRAATCLPPGITGYPLALARDGNRDIVATGTGANNSDGTSWFVTVRIHDR